MDLIDRLFVPETGGSTVRSDFLLVAPDAEAASPLPLIRPDLAGIYANVHELSRTRVHPIGFHQLSNALVGHESLVVTQESQVFAPADVVPDFWRHGVAQRLAAPNDADPLLRLLTRSDFRPRPCPATLPTCCSRKRARPSMATGCWTCCRVRGSS